AVGFDNPEFDEVQHARAVAKHFGTNHHELIVRDCPAELLRGINWYHDEPAADPANVPTFYLARFARQRVTVALTGEGGDEIFAGYRHYRLHRQLLAFEARVPGVQSVAPLLTQIEPWAGERGPRRLWKGAWIATMAGPERSRGLVSVFTDAEIGRLLGDRAHPGGTNGHRIAEFRLVQAQARERDLVSQAMYVDAKTQLADQLLMKVDKTTMAASLEARCPFLDQPLMAYAAALPAEMKLSGGSSRLLLRRALRGRVPDDVLPRPKHGFEVPIRRWLLGKLAPLVSELLLRPGAPMERYMDTAYVRGLVRRLGQARDHHLARQVWTLLNFAVWYEQHWPENRQTDARCA